MNEIDWLESSAPQALLDFVRASGRGSERKLRLFAVACCRRLWPLLADERSRRAVEVAERYADGAATAEDVAAAFRSADDAYWESDDAVSQGACTAAAYLASTALCVLDDALATATATECRAELSDQAALLRDLFGNPFRPLPAVARAGLASGVVALAQAAYDDRLFPSGHLAPARLAALADALERAGGEADLLSHLRGPGPHVRGCWAVDVILGRA